MKPGNTNLVRQAKVEKDFHGAALLGAINYLKDNGI